MAQIALPRQHVTQAPQSAAMGSPLYQRRHASTAGPIELIPNPEFTFPMRDAEGMPSESSARPMSLQPLPTARRGSAAGRRQKSVSALPDFSFNPAGTPAATSTTPPHSPLASPTTPSRPIGGHRRGGSEFIGGDARAGGAPPVLSTSPTKSDDGLSPTNGGLRPVPPAGRRGHVHRRSGAISSHDLSAIINPPPPARAGSAPVTPLEGDEFKFGHSVNKSISQPSLRDSSFFSDSHDSTRRPPSRARVGFSDKVEYIRPLSTISSETETSMSTIRGHSTTNSLSSIISANTSNPQIARSGRPSLSTTLEDDGRPSTAGAILDSYKDAHFNEDVFNRKRPSSAVSPNSPTTVASSNFPRLSSKRRGFFRLRSENIPMLSASASDPAMVVSIESPLPSPMVEDDEVATDSEKLKSSSRKLKPRKVKSWANSIITKKGKHGKKPKGRPPTPPPEAVLDAEDTDASEDVDFEANFDIDNTVTIVSPSEAATPLEKIETDISSWQPRELKRIDSDTMSPVIDLDAALGPFNTPNGPNARGPQRGFGAHRRAMHSAGGLLQHHRRTESAPELVPFELRTTAVAKTSPMADVFEEDEPEDETSSSTSMPRSPASVGDETDEHIVEPKIQVVEAEDCLSGPAINWNFSDAPPRKRKERFVKEETPEPLSPLTTVHQTLDSEQPESAMDVSPVEVVEDYEEPRTSSLTHSSDSTVTPQVLSDESKEDQSVMNVSPPLPQQSLMTPDTYASSFSSPDFRSSQASLDTPRLGTAASSMTDYRAMPSPPFGEPGPELRISVDDVPSLTSSRSTMTSGMQSAFPLMSPRRPGDRSASLCSVPSDVESRRRKRSSIASLSRLINHSSSFAEKSKLSIEQRPHSEYLEPTKESKKRHKRLSKLMQFWKPKETPRA